MYKSIKASFIMASAFSVAAALRIETREEKLNETDPYREQGTTEELEPQHENEWTLA